METDYINVIFLTFTEFSDILVALVIGGVAGMMRLAFNGKRQDREPLVAGAVGAVVAVIALSAVDVFTTFEVNRQGSAIKVGSGLILIAFVSGFLSYDILDWLKDAAPRVRAALDKWLTSRTGAEPEKKETSGKNE